MKSYKVKPYIIAELGANHNGDMNIAKRLIFEAKKAGADCVKFQSWTKDSVFSRKKYEDNFFLGDDYRNRSDYNLEQIVDAYSVSEEQLCAMKEYAEEVGIDFSSTPFNKKEAEFLVDNLDAPFIKVASMDLNNYPFLAFLAEKHKPMIISTGLSELHEIDRAVATIESTGNTDITILHCVATYPPVDSDVHLNNLVTLKRIYPNYSVGFSDHTIGTAIPIAAVALGASVIEKHFTLDKDMPGWDHKVSSTPQELKELSTAVSRVYDALGDFRIKATESDEKKQEFRRSIVLTRAMSAGEKIGLNDIEYKRPGVGIKPELTKVVVGRVLSKDVDFDHILSLEDLV